MKQPPDTRDTFLSAIIDSSDDAIVSKDLNGTVTSWNRGAERIFGYSAAEIVGQPIAILVPSDRPDEEPAILERIRRGERVDHYQTVRRRKDGQLIDVSLTISPVRDAQGCIVGASKVARDITGERRAGVQQALLSAIVESSDDAIVSKDLNGVVTSWNQGAERIFGYTAAEMVGQPITRLIPPDRLTEEPEILRQIRSGQRVEHFETIRQRKDGQLLNVSVNISPIRDPGGQIVGASKVARDVTEQRVMQEEQRLLQEELRRYADDLAHQHRQKDEFMAMLAHELRNPLAPMRMTLELLRHQAESPDEVRCLTARLDRQVRNLNRLVEDLLEMSRLTQGKVSPRMERLDLAQLVRFSCQVYQTQADAAGLGLECAAPDTPVWVSGDATRLDQILDNLLQNALKFTHRGGAVSVTLAAVEGHAVVSIRDNGAGIEPALLPQLFGRFSQGAQTLARTRGGLGLGLAIVKGLVELHGGSVHAQSEGIGLGSEFAFRLPLLEEPSALSSVPPTLRPAGEAARVLVVEDNQDAADSLAELLGVFGYEVQVAYSGTEGVTAAELFSPDIILCDLGLPGMDGFEVARHIRSQHAEHPVRLIAITGYGSEQDRRRAREAGFDQHLVKPVDPDRLLDELTPAR